jgi:hypothetical protein
MPIFHGISAMQVEKFIKRDKDRRDRQWHATVIGWFLLHPATSERLFELLLFRSPSNQLPIAINPQIDTPYQSAEEGTAY